MSSINDYCYYNSSHEHNRSPSPADSCEEQHRKLFLGGLSHETTEDDIRSYFGKYGDVVDVTIKYDAVTGNPRGFGFVTFADDAIERVLSNVPHLLNNKMIVPKRANSRPMRKKIFVGGVDSSAPEEDLKKHFSRFGRVKDIEFPFDRQRCRRRQFCFIVFDSEAGAIAACREPKQRVCGRCCDIQKAQPQPPNAQQRRYYPLSYASNYSSSDQRYGFRDQRDDYRNETSSRRVGYSRRETRRFTGEGRESYWKSSRSNYSGGEENGYQRRKRYRDLPL